MNNRYHYNRNRNWTGYSSNISPVEFYLFRFILIGVLITTVLSLLGEGFNFLATWEDFSFPYNYVAAYYYYIFSSLAMLFMLLFAGYYYISNFLTSPGLTSYPNLNLVLAVVVCLLYTGVLFSLIIVLKEFAKSLLKAKKIIIGLFFCPAIFLIIRLFLVWLFRQGH